jgi:Lsr2
MAIKTKTITEMTDDLDGSTAAGTVSFGWQGTTYELELSKKNAAALEKLLAPYVAASRKVGRAAPVARTRRVKSTNGAGSKEQLQAIREWARSSGYEVAERGRISAAIQDAFHAAR